MTALFAIPSLAEDSRKFSEPSETRDYPLGQKATAPSADETPALVPKPEKDDDEIDLGDVFIGAGGAAAIGGILWGAVKTFLKNTGQSFATKALSSLLKKKERIEKALFPPPPTPKENLIFETLYEAQSFADGVEAIRKGWPELSPTEALRYSFEFLYRYSPKKMAEHPDSDPLTVTARDILRIVERYNLDYAQVYNVARPVVDEYGYGKENIWDQIFKSIFDAKNQGRKSSSGFFQRLDPTLTQSQQLFLAQVRHEKLQLELNAIRDIVHDLIPGVMANSDLSHESPITVRLNQYEVVVDARILGENVGRLALIQMMKGIVDKIDGRKVLSEKEEAFVQRLKEKNPLLQKIIDARTNDADLAINGTNLALRMTEETILGERRWFRKVLDEVRGYEGTVRTGIVVKEADSKVERYDFTYNPSTGQGKPKISLHLEGDPHPVGPLSFSGGTVMVIEGESVSIESSIVVTDARNRNFYITESDLQQFRGIADFVATNPSTAKSVLGKNFLRFYNRIQSLALMIFGSEYQLDAKAPVTKITRLAQALARENWAAVLEQKLEDVLREYRNFDIASLRFVSSGSESSLESAAKDVETRFFEIRREFIEKFPPNQRGEFKKLMIQLEKAVVSVDPVARNEALSGIKAMMARQVGPRKSVELSLDLFDEISAWRGVGTQKDFSSIASSGNVPEEVRYMVAARSADPELAPDISRARKLAADGSYDRAFLEYDRLVVDQDLPVAVKMTAQAEKARLAVERLQFQRAKKAVEWVKWMEAAGYEIPQDAALIIAALPQLNGGVRVVVSGKEKHPAEPTEPAEKTPISVEVERTVLPDPVIFRPKGIKYAVNAWKTGQKIGEEVVGPAGIGAATFLGSGLVIKNILGEPKNQLEGALQGYSTVALSMLLDEGTRKTIEHFGYNGSIMPKGFFEPFSFGNFAGNLGLAMLVYKGVDGVVDSSGIKDLVGKHIGPFDSGDFISLFATGAAYGAARPLMERFAPNVASDMLRYQVAKRSGFEIAGQFLYASKWSPYAIETLRVVKKAGAVIFVVDVGTQLANGAIGLFDTPEETYVVNECTNAVSLPVVGALLPAYYSLLCRAYAGGDISRQAEILKRRDFSRTADHFMLLAAQNVVNSFGYEVSLGMALGADYHLAKDVISDATEKSFGDFQNWEMYDKSNHWLFRSDAVHNGTVLDESAIAYWLEPYLKKIINRNEERLQFMADSEEKKKAMNVLNLYREELSQLAQRHYPLRNDNIYPVQLN